MGGGGGGLTERGERVAGRCSATEAGVGVKTGGSRVGGPELCV